MLLGLSLGRFDEGIAEARIGERLDPLSPAMHHNLGAIFVFARRYDEAVEQFRQAMELEPDYGGPHVRLGDLYVLTGRFQEALDEYQTAESLGGQTVQARVAHVYGRTGRRDEALEILGRLKASGAPGFALALIYLGLGENDRAIESLAQATEDRTMRLYDLNDPVWDPLLRDPRFQRLRRSMGPAKPREGAPVAGLD
jgi:tetratricopeptide (TPR) repeat protein